MQTRQMGMIALCWLSATTWSTARAEESKTTATVSAPWRELTLSPREIERPLLKYRLMPAEHELVDGNAAPIILRLPWDQSPYLSKAFPTLHEYRHMTLDDPRLLNAKNVFPPRFYHELKRAAFRRTADWEYPIGEKPFEEILLPDVQWGRGFVGYGLSVWIRYHIAHGHIDEAREGILVGLANSRHYGRSPFVITQLVCVAIDSMILDRLEELLSQPECPNMYWALTVLPRPLIDISPSVEMQERFLEMTVEGLNNLDRLETEDQWSQLVRRVLRMFLVRQANGQFPELADVELRQILQRLAERARAEAKFEDFADRVAAMSNAEAGLRWFLDHQREQLQELTALTSFDPKVAIPRLEALHQRSESFRSEFGISGLLGNDFPLQGYLGVNKIQRRIDALRVVEAIRNYAATHAGELPATPDNIVETPIPDDPLTGKPFRYEVVEGAAELSAPGIEVEDKEIGAIRYRIELRR